MCRHALPGTVPAFLEIKMLYPLPLTDSNRMKGRKKQGRRDPKTRRFSEAKQRELPHSNHVTSGYEEMDT